MELALLLLAGFLVIASVLPEVQGGAWWIRVFDFPRVQILTGALVVFGALVWQWDAFGTPGRVLTVMLGFAMVLQAVRIFPYTRLASEEARRHEHNDPDRHITLMVANVLQTNRDADALLRCVREADPDVLFAVETDRYWDERMSVLADDYPHHVRCPIDNTYGLLLYARRPLHTTQVRYLVEDRVPSVRTTVELPSGDRFTLYGLHPRPPRPDKNQDSDTRDAELLLVGKEIRDRDGPVITFGDFNDVAWSHTTRLFQRISGLLDPRRGRGFYSTFHAQYAFLRWPLDHVFHSEHFRLVRLHRLPKIGSDHFPILATLSFEPERSHENEKPQPEGNDHEEAEEKIQEGQQEAASKKAEGKE